jgi:nicotinate-nucleotide pyrophosphorylase (carboxylating)
MIPPVPAGTLQTLIATTLAEDLGGRGDVTSLATIPADFQTEFAIFARRSGVICGCQPANEVVRQVDASLTLNWSIKDGDSVKSGQEIARLNGRARSILTAERSVLNFLGRLSGIASLTQHYVQAIVGTKAVIAHTRKTTPGLRALELQAVRAGGGAMHRYGLDDAILIKDNHVAVCGGVGEAVKRARAFAGHMTRVAVEIDHLDQLDEALTAGAESILLDNFSHEDLRSAVERVSGQATLEASGGVDLSTVAHIANTGVDVISVGALTHSAPNFDVGLDEV